MKVTKKAAAPRSRAMPKRMATRFMQKNWENVLEGISDGIIVASSSLNVVFVNHAAQQLTGLSAATLLGKPIDVAFPGNPWLAELVRDVSSGGVSRCLGTMELAGRSGHRYHVSPCASSFFDSQGGVAGIVVRLNDVGHMQKLEETDATGHEAARLSIMAAGLAHEIRNPLGGMKGAAQLLREQLAADPALREYPDLIVREVERVTALLDRLLAPGQRRTAARRRINIHRIVDDVLLLEMGRFPAAITVRRRFDPSLPEVMGNEAALRQVVLNLVKNSIEAMQGRGELTISTLMETGFRIREPGGETDRFLSLEIADNGPGMSADCLSQVFTPFFTTKGGGSGLGLTICQRIVAEHGGSIRIESTPGNGARVRVSLPVAS